MAYTIIEVERKTGIPSTKIRFWIKKGLFPFLQSDKNNVRYFSEVDIEALRWIEYLRQTKMDIKTIKLYMDLYMQGESTIGERKEIVKNQIEYVKADLAKTQEILRVLEQKHKFHEELHCANPTKCLVQYVFRNFSSSGVCMTYPSAPIVLGTIVIFCTGSASFCSALTNAWPTS